MYNPKLLNWYKTKARCATNLSCQYGEEGETQLQLYYSMEAKNYSTRVNEIEKEDALELAEESNDEV